MTNPIDDVAKSADGSNPPEVAVPLPEQAPMDDDAGGPTVPTPAEQEAEKLGDFA